MPRFDQICKNAQCDWTAEIVVRPFENPPCPQCGGETERYYPIGGRTNGVIADSYVGGLTIENLGPEPVTFYSRTEHKRYLKEHGFVERVRHVGTPGEGSDKSKHTTRWY